MQLTRAITGALRSLRRTLSRAVAGAIVCASVAVAAHAADVADLRPEPSPSITIRTPLDTAVGLHAVGDVGKVVVSQPETAQVGAAGSEDLYLIGSQPGSTNLLVYDRQGRLSQSIDVQVGPDAPALRELLALALPGEAISVTALSSSVILDGQVSSPSVAKIAETLAARIVPDGVISRLQARSTQVLLEVQVMEVGTRSLQEISTAIAINNGPELAIDLGRGSIGSEAPHGVAKITGGSGRLSLDATVRALEDKGQLRLVAQPQLVALSGETASFQAGGEFPFPVPADGSQITIQFRPYGAAMTFTPVVQENGLIRIALSAELSDIDPSVSVRIQGLSVPGLKVRRAATVTELRDGEAFLIAGLFEESRTELDEGPPFLSRVPVLGRVLAPIISAARGRSDHRELAIVVTPHLSGQAASPLGARTLLAEVEPPVTPSAKAPPQPAPSAVSARGPPLRGVLSQVRDTLRPPMRWAKQIATRFTNAVLNRA